MIENRTSAIAEQAIGDLRSAIAINPGNETDSSDIQAFNQSFSGDVPGPDLSDIRTPQTIEDLLKLIKGDVTKGDANNNTLTGTEKNDIIFGNKGNDDINGGDGTNLLVGGKGNDNIIGGNGTDVIRGQAGNDTIHGLSLIHI